MAHYLLQLEHFVSSKLRQFEFFEDHFSDPISSRITTVGIIGLVLIITYKIIFDAGCYFGFWDIDPHNKEFFQDKLVHCAHIYIDARVNNESIKYHIEFGPEEYNDEDPELGTTLGFLKKKLYFLFKESEVYERLNSVNNQLDTKFKIDSVKIWKKGKQLVGDHTPLCKLGVETGDKVQAKFIIH